MKRKKLLIISHTEHYKRGGEIVGWGATVNEVNFLSDFWDEVWHIGYLYDSPAPASSKPYTNKNIKFIGLRPSGGESFWSKFGIIRNIPAVLSEISKSILNATEVQFRSPTAMGVYVLPFLSYFVKRRFKFWVKYAGNWKAASPPWSYKFQRWWLKKNYAKCKVTINGFESKQPPHCVSFENPCLTEQNIANGKTIQAAKNFNAPFRLIFIGRLDDAKGVSRIIEALQKMNLSLIENIDFVGDGVRRKEYEERTSFLGNKVQFHGFLTDEIVHALLKKAHFFLLPSISEGFPKVIAEAACYGCVPVVSDVGCIEDYVKNELNGFIWKLNGTESFSQTLEKALTSSKKELEKKSKKVLFLAELFTFENYLKKLEKHIF